MLGSQNTLNPDQVKNAFDTLGELASKGISNSTTSLTETSNNNGAAAADVSTSTSTSTSALEDVPESDTGAASTMYNIDGEPGVDAEGVAEEDKKFKYKDLGEVNTERQTKEMDPLSELKTGGRRRSRRRNNKKSAKKSAKRTSRKSAKKGGKKHRKSAKKGAKKRSYRKH